MKEIRLHHIQHFNHEAMVNKVKVVLKNGSVVTLPEWQKLYGLKIGSDAVGKHFSLRDAKLRQDIQDYGELIVNEMLVRLLDEVRDQAGVPMIINSFNRNEAKQKSLHDQGFKTATVSPHVVKMAADINCTTAVEVRKLARLIIAAANGIGIKARVGFQQYLNEGMTFVHVDVCPEYYAPGKPFNSQPHPAVWENVISW